MILIKNVLNNEDIQYITDKISEYPNSKDWFSRILSDLGFERHIYIYKINNKICGFIIIKKSKEENKICSLFVDYKYRNKGIATRLCEIAINNFKNNSFIVHMHKYKKNEFKKFLMTLKPKLLIEYDIKDQSYFEFFRY